MRPKYKTNGTFGGGNGGNNHCLKETFDRCVKAREREERRGEANGSATTANIPADPKSLCFVRRSWTGPLKRLTMQ